MAGNAFGTMFRFTTWGESHGPAIGVVVDGVPPRLPLTEADIQADLDRRKPGQSRFTTQRREADAVRILSGVFEGLTTGTPVSLLIENQDQRSKDYGEIATLFRPGHADYTYWKKYGIRDYRGGGRSSARETACRVAAGAIARRILGSTISIRAAVIQLGPHRIDRDRWDWQEVGRNPFFCPDAGSVEPWGDFLDGVRKAGSSAGAVIEVVATGVPAGLGDPIYDKLDGDLARALMTINAVKGVEIGDGFAAAALGGEDNADEMRATTGAGAGAADGIGPSENAGADVNAGADGDADASVGAGGSPGVRFLSNHAGGILGGISTGQEVVARFAVKPTSSILTPRRTVDVHGQDREIVTKGRHDPCVGIRAVPVAEAMVACVLADHLLRHRALVGGGAV